MKQFFLAVILSIGFCLIFFGFIRSLIYYYEKKINEKYLKNWYSQKNCTRLLPCVNKYKVILLGLLTLFLSGLFIFLLVSGIKGLKPILFGEKIPGVITKIEAAPSRKGKIKKITVTLENNAKAYFYSPAPFSINQSDSFFWSPKLPKRILPDHFFRNWAPILFAVPIFSLPLILLFIQLSQWTRAAQITKNGEDYRVEIENFFTYTVKGNTRYRIFFRLPTASSEVAYADNFIDTKKLNPDQIRGHSIKVWTLDKKTWAYREESPLID